jgi:hypothetical protein
MPIIAQICMIVVTIALVVMAAMAVSLMLQTKVLIETANRSLAELPALIEEARRTSARADELLLAFSKITRSARTTVLHFENLAAKSSTLALTLLDEVEPPISRAVSVIRGIRAGASHFIQGLKSRVGRRSQTQEGEEHAGEERWLDDGGDSAGGGGRGGVCADLRANGR